VRDFAPVSIIVSTPNVVTVHPAVPAQSIAELLALARAKPGELNYSAGSTGSTQQLAAELFKRMGNVDIVRISYKGSGPALNAVIAGQVQLMFPSAGSVMQHVKAGRLRALAVTSKARTRIAPDVLTIAEAGYKDFDGTSWYGMSVASRTPPAIVARLHSETVSILRLPEIERRLNAEGVDIVGSDPAAFDQFIRLETARWGKVIKDAGIKAGQEP